MVGAGPNGLAAAVALARAGLPVRVVESAATPGGGCRTAELTVPGVRHDVCAAVHPTGAASPFLASLAAPVSWLHPPLPLAHPFDDGTAAVLARSVAETAAGLGADGTAYRRLFRPLVARADDLLADLFRPPVGLPSSPLPYARFLRAGLRPALRVPFRDRAARALLVGCAAHTGMALGRVPTAAYGVFLLLLGHAVGWPFAAGGSQSIVDAMVAELAGLGGAVETGRRVGSVAELPRGALVVADVTPRQLAALAGDRLPAAYRRRLAAWRHGPGAFKVDYLLSGPVPWTAPECRAAGTVHVGGTAAEVAAAEADANAGRVPERPFVLVAQPSLVDPSRAPAGRHVLWAYCHVPAGCDVDVTDRVEAQLERFAPGFRDLVVARAARGPAALEAYDENYVGGDVTGGVPDLGQMLRRRYATPDPLLWLCSSSTPPGAGVHGMCGVGAARAALRRVVHIPG